MTSYDCVITYDPDRFERWLNSIQLRIARVQHPRALYGAYFLEFMVEL